MSGWDDLFSAAAGVEPVIEQSAPKRQASGDNKDHQTKKKKRKASDNRNKSQNSLEAILKSRTDPIAEQVWSHLPSWLSLGRSLCSRKSCTRWNQKDNCGMDALCNSCGLSALHHSFNVNSSLELGQGGNILKVFTLVRDIRCCCSCVLEETNVKASDEHMSHLMDYAKTALTKAGQLLETNLHADLPPGEAEILTRKFRSAEQSAKKWKESMKSWSKEKRDKDEKFQLKGVFDDLVRLMIDCDAAYFRIYYLQNAGYLQLNDTEAFVPHPPTYFGSNNVTWNVAQGSEWKSNFADAVRSGLKQGDDSDDVSDDELDEMVDNYNVTNPGTDLDPLSFMRHNRLNETIAVFWKSGWMDSNQALRQTIESMKPDAQPRDRRIDPEEEFYDSHQTLAPSILQDFRDSCRDLLCNLYAYATLSPQSIGQIKTTLQENGVVNVLEMGAGTGYLAHLLNKADMNVSAFDVAPTKTLGDQQNNADILNEYHGCSPSYYEVKSAHSANIASLLKSQKEAKNTALLLCYPPPMSSMAEDTLNPFLACGGRMLVHIGEFKGLTGSTSFEHLLRRDFRLLSRTQCLHWGTDAAEVTVWMKQSKGESQNLPPLLLPCSHCQEAEAVKRCRLSRPLVYCGSACFDLHDVQRKACFAFSAIPTGMARKGMISFHDQNHFTTL